MNAPIRFPARAPQRLRRGLNRLARAPHARRARELGSVLACCMLLAMQTVHALGLPPQLAASEVWVTLIFGVIMYLFRNELKQKKVTKILMIVCIARLLSDAVFWAFDGVPGLFWGTLTRCSNYVTFVSNDLVSLVFSIFLWNLVKDDEEKSGIVLKADWALEAVAIGALSHGLKR